MIYVLRRTQEMLATLGRDAALLRDPMSEQVQQPSYAQNEYRSLKPEVLVVEGVCTHFGCAPAPRFEVGPADLGADWPGGFFCPCHGSKFDLAGRVFSRCSGPDQLARAAAPLSSTTARLLIGSDSGNFVNGEHRS